MAQDYNTFSFEDYDGEDSNVKINTVEITAANLDAQQTLLTTLRTAMNAILLGTVNKSVVSDIGWDTYTQTTDPFGQREIRWTIVSEDINGNRFRSNELPMANLALLEGGSKFIIKNGVVSVVTGAAAVTAFKDAYEAVAVSNTGLALTIVDMYQSGKNI